MRLNSTRSIPVITRQRKVVYTTSDRKHKEWRLINVPVEQECQGFVINYNGKEVQFYVPVAHINNGNPFSFICDEYGNQIKAEWQHGRGGSMKHIEPALFDWKHEKFVQTARYCDGIVKDSAKYMLNVLI